MNIDTQPYPNYVKSVPSILIHNQVITGEKVFEYFGKLVEGKKAQEERVNHGDQSESDQGQCRINEDGELEGWCGDNSVIEFEITGRPDTAEPRGCGDTLPDKFYI
mgnify:CR=1 FL=1